MGRMVGSNAFYIAFSTKKARGTALQLAFEWGAGNQDGNFSWSFPLEWKAEYAVDGGEFQPLRDAATGREILQDITLRRGVRPGGPGGRRLLGR